MAYLDSEDRYFYLSVSAGVNEQHFCARDLLFWSSMGNATGLIDINLPGAWCGIGCIGHAGKGMASESGNFCFQAR